MASSKLSKIRKKQFFSKKIAWLITLILLAQAVLPNLFLCTKDENLHFQFTLLSCCSTVSHTEDRTAEEVSPCSDNSPCPSQCAKTPLSKKLSDILASGEFQPSTKDCCISLFFWPELPKEYNLRTSFLDKCPSLRQKAPINKFFTSSKYHLHWDQTLIDPPPSKLSLFSILLI